jgi:hypothetical protein
MKKTLVINLWIAIVLFSCTNPDIKENSVNPSAVAALKKKKIDSAAIDHIQPRRVVTISDQSVNIKKEPALKKVLIYENGVSTYRHKNAERMQSFLITTIRLESKSKLNGRAGKFFPNINVHSVNSHNEAKYIGSMDYQLYKPNTLNTLYLEQIFDYKDSENFVCWIAVDIPLKEKLIISVNKPDDKNIDVKNVIGTIEMETKNGLNAKL